MKLKAVAAALALAGMAMATSANATFIVDNFDLDPPALTTATDTTPDGNGVVVPTQNGTGSTIMNLANGGGLWDRNYYANLTTGASGIATEQAVACFGCDTGHVNSSSNATGHGGFYYNGGNTVDLSGYSSFELDYDADIAGGDVYAAFYSGAGGVGGLIQALHLGSDLLGGNVVQHLSGALLGDFSDVGWVSLFVNGTSGDGSGLDQQGFGFLMGAAAPGLDANIDNIGFNSVPEPGMIALLGLGLAGLGASRRRKQ